MTVVAVVGGTVLNKAPGGKKFEGILVQYSKSAETHPQALVKITRSKGAGAILVSGNAEAEKLLGSGAAKMRVSTFRKAFDTDGDQDSGRGSDRSSGGGRGNRSPRKNRQKQSSNEPRETRQPKEASPTDAINELIDLVD